MNTVLYGNKVESKLDNKKGIMHYEILEGFAKEKTSILKWNLIIFIGSYLFLREYPTALASLDFSFTVLAVIYVLALKPLMLKGKIPAYYRREYNKLNMLYKFVKLFIKGGVIRFMVIALYYAITFYLVRDNTYDVVLYQNMALEIIVSPKAWLIATISFAIVLYVLFYHKRYVSIQEFSNRVSNIFTNNFLTEKGAVNEFVYQKDRELAIHNANGVKYDGVDYNEDIESAKYVTETTAHTKNNDKVVDEAKAHNEEPVVDEDDVPEELIRRRARR